MMRRDFLEEIYHILHQTKDEHRIENRQRIITRFGVYSLTGGNDNTLLPNQEVLMYCSITVLYL